MADLEFDVAKRRSEPITFTIGKSDHEYVFNPPKSAVMMLPIIEPGAPEEDGKQTKKESHEEAKLALTKATFDWLGEGLSKEDHELLVSRLKDPKDDLDVPTLSNIVKGLSERIAARPTT